MAGLMDASIIRPELSNALAAGYQQAEQSRQLLAQQRQQTEINQTKLEQLKQDRMMLNQLQDQLRAAGKDPDPNKIFDAFIASGNPDYVLKGMEYRQRYKELQRADDILRREAPELFATPAASAAAPGAPAAAPGALAAAPTAPALNIRSRSEGTVPPVAAPGTAPSGLPTSAPIPQVGGPIATPNVTAAPLAPAAAGGVGTFGTQVGPPNPQADMTPEDRAFSKLASDWVMGGMQGPQPTRADAAAIVNTGRAPVNALAPVAAPVNALTAPGAAPAAPGPVNALAAPQDRAAELRKKILLYSSSTDPRVKNMVETFKNELQQLNKMYVVPGVGLVNPGTKETIVPTQSEFERTLKGLNLPPDQERALRLQWAQKQATHAPSAQQNVFAYTPASEEAQKDFIKSSRATYDSLKNAPSVLENIEEAKKLIPGAKKFMGPGGEPILQAASFMNNRFGTRIDTKGITDASELRSRLFNGVIENLRKLDAQPTAAQQQVLQDAIGNLGTDPTALPRVLDAYASTVRSKVSSYNEEVSSAEQRGVKFPYKPQIKLPEFKQAPGTPAAPAAGSWSVVR